MTITEAEKLIEKTKTEIKPLNGKILKEASEKMDGLLKPPGSLGIVESIGIKLAAIQETLTPSSEKKLSLIYAADHGIATEGVTASPQFVTAIMVKAFIEGKAGINVLAGQAGSIIKVYDVGIASTYTPPEGLTVNKIRSGSGNFIKEKAMSREETILAVAYGISSAKEAIKETGAVMSGIGEMGIGNTTPAAALTAVFTGTEPSVVTGSGTGVGQETIKRKIQVIREALKLHNPDPADAIGTLSAVGGIEIAAMCGAMLGAASSDNLVIIDGFISGAAALAAAVLVPESKERMLLSHLSAEPGHRIMASEMELKPVLDLGFRLGEGTGAAAVMPLAAAGADLLSKMGTLQEELIKLEDPS